MDQKEISPVGTHIENGQELKDLGRRLFEPEEIACLIGILFGFLDSLDTQGIDQEKLQILNRIMGKLLAIGGSELLDAYKDEFKSLGFEIECSIVGSQDVVSNQSQFRH